MKERGTMEPNGFWSYVEKWREIFPQEKSLRWETNWIENDYCAGCRFCCGPQDSPLPFPMPLLPQQFRLDLEKDFYLLDSATPYLGSNGCKADTEHGCRLLLGQKPTACGLFPIVFINGGLYLYQNCPAVVFTPLIRFLEFAQKAAGLLEKLEETELRRLSLWFTADVLARSYIDLRIQLLTPQGKKIASGVHFG